MEIGLFGNIVGKRWWWRMSELEQQLIRHEGLRDKPYEDSVGVLTIGVGHNMETHPVAQDIIMRWLREDIEEAKNGLFQSFPFVATVERVRQEVFINMSFNLGITRLRGFKKMWAAVERGDWEIAAKEMIDSKWARQVGKRATELAEQLHTGERQNV